MPVYDDPIGGVRLDAGGLLRWTTMLVERLGAPADIAADVADLLIASDLRGIASHGTARLPQYVKLAEARVMDPAARPVLVEDAPEQRWQVRFAMIAGLLMLVVGAGCLFSAARTVTRQR